MIMKQSKVLHVTNWYPNAWHEHEGVFIKEQFDVFSQVTDSKLVCVQVRPGESWFGFRYFRYGDKESGYFVLTKVKSSKLIELITTLLLLFVLKKENVNEYDLLHVHMAYPLLAKYHWWKKWLKAKLVISEHWSAYHNHFYMPKETRKLDGIKRIFRQKIPVVTVSVALLNDIQKFSGTDDFKSYVLPNVIDQERFHYYSHDDMVPIPQFFMVNLWREIKNPFPLLDAIHQLTDEGVELRLILGGYGPLLAKMQLFVDEKKMGKFVLFSGAMSKPEIAAVLMESDAYLFSSQYETFSVACAQALCCGVPLIGPPIPAILEYADDKNMITVTENCADDWKDALRQFLNKRNSFSRKDIAESAAKRFSTEVTMEKYGQIVDELLSEVI